MTTLLTPIDLSASRQTGPRVWRKQVLAKRQINYKGRTVNFDDDYLTDLAASFNAGAYDHVPFILADEQNRHTMDPMRYHGAVKALEVTPDGIDAVLELSEEAAELVQRTGGRLGVSARIKEALEHVDGRRFKRAVNHVLGTLDPRMTGMRPWEPVVDLSADDDGELIDLSDYTYQGDTMHGRKIDVSNLSDEQLEQLESYAAVQGIDLAVEYDDEDGLDLSDDDETDEDGDDEPNIDHGTDGLEPLTEAELDAMLEAAVAEVHEPELVGAGAGVELSDDDLDGAIDLAAAMVADNEDEVQVARRQTAGARYELAAERYGNDGVPPFILELARPVLELADDDTVLELSSPATGDPIDVRGIVTGLLDAFRGTVDLSTEDGYSHEDPAEQQENDTADRWTAYLENN